MLTKVLFVLATALSATNALGINCRGSALCVGNKGILGQAQGQIRGLDPNRSFRDGEHITCVKSSISIGDPSLCVFYQNTGRTWTARQTVDYVQRILDHGCKACGSVPTDPGNDVSKGQLTANMVSRFSRRSLGMSQQARRDVETEEEDESSTDSEEPEVDTDVIATPAFDDSPSAASASPISKREEDTSANPMLAPRALGINCRGSSTCAVGGILHTPAGTLQQVRDAVAAGPEGRWAQGQQIVCVRHAFGRLCAFYQNVGSRTYDKGQTVAYLERLQRHGCYACGSVPTDPGNNVSNGQLTVNYVA